MMESDPEFAERVEAAVRSRFSDGAVTPVDELPEADSEDFDAFILS